MGTVLPESPPYFPFYPKDIESDGVVEAMTTEEFGAYMKLLCKAWNENPPGTIPNDDAILARWARLSRSRWAKVKAAVVKAFSLNVDNRFHQKRMKKEFEKFRQKSEAARESANRRWKDDANAMRTHESATPFASNPHMPMDARASATVSESNSEAVSSLGLGVQGEGEKPEFWIVREWLHHAKALSPANRDLKTLSEHFAEMIRGGADPKEIAAKIANPARVKTQTHWQFQKQYFPDRKQTKPAPGSADYLAGINEFLKAGKK